MRFSWKPHLCIIGANILFALNYSYSKSVLSVMSADALVAARIGSAAVFFMIIALIFFRQRVARRDIALLVLASMFGIGGNQFIFLRGLAETSPVDASILATLGPVFVLLISVFLGRDRITLLKSIGISVGAAGALSVILYGGLNSLSGGGFYGNLLILCSVLSYALYLIVVRELMAKYSPFFIMGMVFGISSIVIVPLMWGDLISVRWDLLSAGSWGAFVFVIVGATWGAYLLVAGSLKKLSPTTASIYSYSQPVLASFFAIFRGQDQFSFIKIVSALLVFAGVYLVMLSYRPKS